MSGKTATAFTTEHAALVRDTATKARDAGQPTEDISILLINTHDPMMASLAQAWALPERSDGVLCAAISRKSAGELLGTLGLPTDTKPTHPSSVQVCTLASAESVAIAFIDLGAST